MTFNEKALDRIADKIFEKKRLKAIAEGTVKFGDIEVNCAVLNDEDETTVFTLRAFESAIGIPKQEGGKTVAEFLPTFMRQNNIKPYIYKYLPLPSFQPISFSLKRGGKALGITVEQADKVMYGWIDAYQAGDVTKPQKKIAAVMQAMKNAASVSGFTQVIHEQLGYEDRRTKTITDIFNRIFEKEYHIWAREFEIEFYEHIYRLYDKTDEWKKLLILTLPGKKPQTPSWVGHITRDIIYARLNPPEILQVLDKKNPVIKEKGQRQSKHHQYLTKDYGLKILQEHKGAVMLLMRQCKSWVEFYGKLEEFCPIKTPQMRFDFMDKGKSVSDEVHPELF